MATHQSLWAQLDQTFSLDIPITDQLLELLQRERKTLENREYDEFQQIIGQKQQLLTQLEQHASDRQQLLHNAGFDNEATTLTMVDQQAPLVAKAWRRLNEQWLQCKRLNEINERIAKRTRLVVGQILDLLRGQSSQDKLYTREGNASSTGGGRTITSA